MTDPLNSLLRREVKSTELDPLDEQLHEFQELKQALVEPAFSALRVWNRNFLLETDYSAYQMGVTLL